MTPQRPSLQRESAYLAGGSAAAGIFVYAFVLVGVRALGSDDFAPVSLLWSYWLFAAAAVALPLQHWLIRTAIVGGSPDLVRRTVRRVGFVCVAVAVAEFVAFVPLRERVFDDDSLLYPAAFALMTVGAFTMGLARGRQAARGRYAWVAASQAGENALRLLGAVIGAVAGFGPQYFVVLMPMGFLVALVPPSAMFAAVSIPEESAESSDGREIIGIAGATLIPQVLWAAGPFVVAWSASEGAAVTGLFLALSLARLPNVIANATGLRLLEWMSGRSGDLYALRRSIIGVGAALTVVVAGAAGFVGSSLLRNVFGDDVVVTNVEAAAVGGGGMVAVTVLLLSLSLVAEGRALESVTSGVAALVTFAIGIVVGAGQGWTITTTSAVAFASAQLVYLVAISARATGPSNVG